MQTTLDVLWRLTRAYVLEALPRKQSPEIEAEIESLDLPDLLIRHFNWWTRLIPQMPRQVHYSKRMKAYLVDGEESENVQRLGQSIEEGKPLWPHLSRGVKAGFVTGADDLPKRLRPRRRPDIDLFLNDWCLHHLHLRFEQETDGFYQRSRFMLVAYFCEGHAFLIDIIDHGGEWTRERIIQSTLDTWDDWVLFPKLEGILGSDEPISEEDRLSLRKAGLATPIQISDDVFVPVFGLTTAGTSVRASMMAGHVLDGLEWVADRWKRYDPDRLGLSFQLEGYAAIISSTLFTTPLGIDLRRFCPFPTNSLPPAAPSSTAHRS